MWRRFDQPIREWSKVSPAEVLGSGAGLAPVCRLTDWGLLPFADASQTHVDRQLPVADRGVGDITVGLGEPSGWSA